MAPLPSSDIIRPRQVRRVTRIGLYGPLARVLFLLSVAFGALLTWTQPSQGLVLHPVLMAFVLSSFGGVFYLACFFIRLKGEDRIGDSTDDWLEYVQAIVDSILIMTVIYVTGSQTTSWVIFLMVAPTYYMTTAGPRFGTALSIGLGLLYSTTVLLESARVIPYAPIHEIPVFERYVSVAVVNFGAIGSVLGALGTGIFVGWITFRSFQNLILSEQKTARKYNDLIHGISDIIWECDRSGNFTFVSGGLREILGYAPEEVLGKSFRSLCASDDLERVDLWFRNGGAEKGGTLDYGAVAKDLTLHWISTTVTPIHNDRNSFSGFRGTARDVTNARIAEDRLSRAQRYEAVAALASGIAHDFNNLFNAINGFAQLERLNANEGTESAENLDAVVKATRRGTALTSNLLNLSRPQLFRKVPVSPADLLENTRQIARASVGPRIQIDIECRTERKVLGDENLLSSVLLNLCINARDAIGKNDGRILMTADGSGTDRVTIRVEDTGSGIPPDLKEKIFLPFYTTKPRGSGTGLGLAMARKIVNEHGGTLEPGSSKLGGASFTITLPAAGDEGLMPAAAPEAGEVTGPGLSCRIVVVDDEEQNLAVFSKYLERRGHQVVPFTSGTDALRWLEQNNKPVSAIVLDMVMPEKSGLETFRELRQLHPELPVMFISGYAETDHIRAVLAEHRTTFMAKPLELARFADLVEKLIQG